MLLKSPVYFWEKLGQYEILIMLIAKGKYYEDDMSSKSSRMSNSLRELPSSCYATDALHFILAFVASSRIHLEIVQAFSTRMRDDDDLGGLHAY